MAAMNSPNNVIVLDDTINDTIHDIKAVDYDDIILIDQFNQKSIISTKNDESVPQKETIKDNNDTMNNFYEIDMYDDDIGEPPSNSVVIPVIVISDLSEFNIIPKYLSQFRDY